jgi:hypothetical protein
VPGHHAEGRPFIRHPAQFFDATGPWAFRSLGSAHLSDAVRVGKDGAAEF